MLAKTSPDEIQSFLSDASYMQGGRADQVLFPQNAEDIAEILAKASREGTPVTVSGAGTGTVGGRIPCGGLLLATDNLNEIKSLIHTNENNGSATAEAGVRLADFQRFVETEGLFYPPDPTERSCYLGGTVATNASGARTFKYGPTRKYIQRLRIALASGEIIDIRRGEHHADKNGFVRLPVPSGQIIEARLPEYRMPRVRKNAAGYYVAPKMDLLDLFIGSEGTLGVIVEIEASLINKPEKLLSGVVFFSSEDELLAFVREARERSLATRQNATSVVSAEGQTDIDARALEYFDVESLNFLRQRYESVPADATGAIFFEQETTNDTEDTLMSLWLALLERHNALADTSWFAVNEQEQAKLREFRHALPVLMNEWFARHRQRKVSTDMAVPDDKFPEMLKFYEDNLRGSDVRYTIFGHIGDNHVHVNILPRDDQEAESARALYGRFIKKAVELGGTISAEHGIGKLKREYLRELYGEEHLQQMATLKKAFDPSGVLGRGNIFSEEYLTSNQ